MRQAQESEIIRLSMHIRNGKPIQSFKAQNKEVMIISKKDLQDNMLLWADQILCATNRTRASLNAKMRQLKEFSDQPQVNDKIINLHNEWDLLSTKFNPLTNGIIGNLQEYNIKEVEYPPFLRGEKFSIPIGIGTMTGDEDEIFEIMFDYNELIKGTPSLTRAEEYALYKSGKYPIPLHMNYGYAITTWKAQGSEYPKVILFAENWPNETDLRRRFLYTGITRAQSNVLVVI